MFEAALAVLGEPHGMRGPLQKPQAQQALQGLQPPAHGGLRRAQPGGRRGQAAGFDDAHEGLHQFQPIGRGRAGRGLPRRVGTWICHAPIV
jgi:hypothetical protein